VARQEQVLLVLEKPKLARKWLEERLA